MKTNIKHLVHWNDWNIAEIEELLDFSIYVKQNSSKFLKALEGKSLAMIFQKTSTRTRVSFEAAMTELGGHAIFIRWEESNFKISDIEFEIQYLSRNVSLILARVLQHVDLVKIKESSQVPVINGCCNLYHPCQVLSDVLTMKLHSIKPLNEIKLCYIGVYNNIANSLFNICSILNINLKLICPIIDDGFSIDKNILETNLNETIKDADYIYTDTWLNMEFFEDENYKEAKKKREEIMLPYQINQELLKFTNAKVMHDMPIHNGYEITKQAVYSDRSIIFEQAANRLMVQKAIILRLLEKNKK